MHLRIENISIAEIIAIAKQRKQERRAERRNTSAIRVAYPTIRNFERSSLG